MKKGIFVVLAVLIFFAISLAEEKLFFESWEAKTAVIRPDGFLQATLINPNQEEGIKSVVVLVVPPDEVLAYWYFGQFGDPFVFELKEDKYVRSPDHEKTCIQCHKDKAKIHTS